MNYGNIKSYDIADGTGVRVSLFVSGCRHHCKGCFNAPTWDFNYGEPYTRETQDKILELLAPSYIEGFSLLGGEPFERRTSRSWQSFWKRSRALTRRNPSGATADIFSIRTWLLEARSIRLTQIVCFLALIFWWTGNLFRN